MPLEKTYALQTERILSENTYAVWTAHMVSGQHTCRLGSTHGVPQPILEQDTTRHDQIQTDGGVRLTKMCSVERSKKLNELGCGTGGIRERRLSSPKDPKHTRVQPLPDQVSNLFSTSVNYDIWWSEAAEGQSGTPHEHHPECRDSTKYHTLYHHFFF